ncbi:MAG TPA: hypothetical protein VFB06_25235 [Streptosporangiaceae bacterium]|nr:hypothetical protein [Streptosporangiaceae bacterium]
MPTRRLLIGAVPLLFATAGCSSADLFAGPDPLHGPPSLAPETVVLSAAITAEERLVALYRSVLAGRAAGRTTTLLTSLLSQHEAHLTQLKARLVVPPGYHASPSASASASAGAASAVARLRAAEQASAAALTRQLTGVSPALAQLFASIAASDATHATALAAL